MSTLVKTPKTENIIVDPKNKYPFQPLVLMNFECIEMRGVLKLLDLLLPKENLISLGCDPCTDKADVRHNKIRKMRHIRHNAPDCPNLLFHVL